MTFMSMRPCPFCGFECVTQEALEEHEHRVHQNYKWASNPRPAPSWECDPSKSRTACKHGERDCEVCGTSSRRDYKHTTLGGRGRIARIK